MPRRTPQFYFLRRSVILGAVILAIIFGGAGLYRWIESVSDKGPPPYIDALYNVVMVLTAIGGDKPDTSAGKIFMCILALVSAGLLVSVLAQVLRFLSSKSLHDIANAIHDRKVLAMENHVIICGTSHTLLEFLRSCQHRERVWVIVKTAEEASHLHHFGIVPHVEDFTTEHALQRAGITHAACVIACGEDDAQNAFVCLSAKHLRKNIPVIVRLTRSDNRQKLLAAGADHIISPAELAAAELRKSMDTFAPAS
jgi:voltage-gated potassium channel